MTSLDTNPTTRPVRILIDGKLFILGRAHPCTRWTQGAGKPHKFTCERCGVALEEGAWQYRRPRDSASDMNRRRNQRGHRSPRWRQHRGQRHRRFCAPCTDFIPYKLVDDETRPCPA